MVKRNPFSDQAVTKRYIFALARHKKFKNLARQNAIFFTQCEVITLSGKNMIMFKSAFCFPSLRIFLAGERWKENEPYKTILTFFCTQDLPKDSKIYPPSSSRQNEWNDHLNDFEQTFALHLLIDCRNYSAKEGGKYSPYSQSITDDVHPWHLHSGIWGLSL